MRKQNFYIDQMVYVVHEYNFSISKCHIYKIEGHDKSGIYYNNVEEKFIFSTLKEAEIFIEQLIDKKIIELENKKKNIEVTDISNAL